MRSTVSKILETEATRLYEISIREGLTTENLIFLNKLIDTYEKFVGSTEGEEVPPEEQDTAALLASLAPKPEPKVSHERKKEVDTAIQAELAACAEEARDEPRLSKEGGEKVAVGSGRRTHPEEVPQQGQGSPEGQEVDS